MLTFTSGDTKRSYFSIQHLCIGPIDRHISDKLECRMTLIIFRQISSHLHRTIRSEEHTSELQSRPHLVCRLLLEKKKKQQNRDLGPDTRQHDKDNRRV